MERAALIDQVVSGAVVACAAASAALVLGWWLRSDPGADLLPRVALTPPELASLSSPDPRRGSLPVDLRGRFAAAAGIPLPVTGSWPRFRGAALDNVSRETVPLAEGWGAAGPPVLWSIDVGQGHAGPAVHEGRVYLLDYDEREESDVLRCLSLADGREIWRRWYRTGAKRNHGISRTVPAVSGGRVVSIGPRCHVLCVDAVNGQYLWGIDLAREYGAAEPLWYAAQHPLIDGDTVVLAPGGSALLIGVDAATGRVIWRTPNPRGWKMSHSSVVPMTVDGQRMYVYAALGGLVGVAAEGPRAGAVLWETSEWNHSVVAPTPVILEGGRLLVTAGYGVGSALFQVRAEGGAWRADLVRRFGREEFACEQQTPVFFRGHLFTVMPKDGGALREQFVCMGADGRPRYGSGKDARYGLGPFLVADDKVYILSDEGELTVARASTEEFLPLWKGRVLDGKDAWGPMAIADGRLLLRDSRRLVCLDARAQAEASPARAARNPDAAL
jgi:outer membrane protein assembly factor BamB